MISVDKLFFPLINNLYCFPMKIPLHFCVLQGLVNLANPSQFSEGPSQVRVLTWTPPPHSAEQVLHDDHSDQYSSTSDGWSKKKN